MAWGQFAISLICTSILIHQLMFAHSINKSFTWYPCTYTACKFISLVSLRNYLDIKSYTFSNLRVFVNSIVKRLLIVLLISTTNRLHVSPISETTTGSTWDFVIVFMIIYPHGWWQHWSEMKKKKHSGATILLDWFEMICSCVWKGSSMYWNEALLTPDYE